jgi:hypothetical protein
MHDFVSQIRIQLHHFIHQQSAPLPWPPIPDISEISSMTESQISFYTLTVVMRVREYRWGETSREKIKVSQSRLSDNTSLPRLDAKQIMCGST